MAAETAPGLLHRTGVAFKAMTDDRVRQSANHAQVEQGRRAREEYGRTSELAPVIRHFEQTAEFLDLVGACHAFVATTNRVIPDAGAALDDVCWLSVCQGAGKPSSWGEPSPKWWPCLETVLALFCSALDGGPPSPPSGLRGLGCTVEEDEPRPRAMCGAVCRFLRVQTQALRQRVHGPYVRLHCAARPLASRRGR